MLQNHSDHKWKNERRSQVQWRSYLCGLAPLQGVVHPDSTWRWIGRRSLVMEGGTQRECEVVI